MKPLVLLVLATALAEAEPGPPVAIVHRLLGTAVRSGPGLEPPAALRLYEVLAVASRLAVDAGSEAHLAFPSGARYRLGAGARGTLTATGVTVEIGPIDRLPAAAPFPALTAIDPAEQPGARSAAVRIRAPEITGLAPHEPVRALAQATVLSFVPVAGASRYQVEVRQPAGDLVFEVESEEPRVVLPPGSLEPGRVYHWSVATVDRAGPVARGAARFATLDAATAAALSACEPAGLSVTAVESASAGSLAGLEAGDRLLGWCWAKDFASCAAPRRFATPFDWLELEMDAVQRGGVRVVGERAGEPRGWDLLPTLQGIAVGLDDGPAPSLCPALGAWRALEGARAALSSRREAAADAAFEAALAAVESDPRAAALVAREWADALVARADFAHAERLLAGALETAEAVAPESLAVARLLSRIGNVHERQDRLGEAEAFYRRAHALALRLAPGSGAEAAYANNLALCASGRGDWAEAEALTERAVDIRRRLTPEGAARVPGLTTLGTVRLARGDLIGADQALLEALELLERNQPGSPRLASVLHNLGMIAHFRGDDAGAEAMLRRELALAEAADAEPAVMRDALIGLAETLLEIDRPVQAEALLRRALAIGSELDPAGPKAAWNLQSLGSALLGQNRLAEARGSFQHALELWQGLDPNAIEVGSLRLGLAQVALRQGDAAGAEREAQAALGLFERFALPSVVDAHHVLAQTWLARGELARAAESFRHAVAELDAKRGRLGGAEESRWLFDSSAGDLHFEAAHTELLLGRTAEAWALLEQGRARGFQRLLAQRDLRFPLEVPPDLEQERRRLAADLDDAQATLLTAREEPERVRGVARLHEIRLRQAALDERLRSASPRRARLRQPEPMDLARGRSALDPGTLLLTYAVGESGSWLFAIEPEVAPGAGLTAIELPISRAALAAEVATLRALVGRGDSARADVERQATKLYDQLIRPAEAVVRRARRLLISPDGPLHRLPFAALRGDGAYLVERFALHFTPSVAVYDELARARRRPFTTPAGSLLLVGDPVDPESPASLRAVLGREVPLGALPGTRAEVAAIAGLFPRATVLLGPAATEEAVKAEAPRARLVHLAVHGLIDERFPLSSGLALTAPETRTLGQDNGFLQAWEIFERLELDADLVTLSACDTALGRDAGGEGILGLTRALHYAGARSVLASLWTVSDLATPELMARLYRHLRAGESKDEALRRAQNELLLTDWSHPYFWAGFQLSGSWK